MWFDASPGTIVVEISSYIVILMTMHNTTVIDLHTLPFYLELL